MKRYILMGALALCYTLSFAQSVTESFMVNGLKVIFRPTQKETVSIGMYYRGGIMNYAPQQAGIENLALAAAAACGTKNFSVGDYQELADEYGVEIKGASKEDYGLIRMDCIDRYFDNGWKLFADAVVNPAFNEEEFRNTKDKMIAAIYSRESDPETRIEQMSATALFNGTSYDVDPVGTAVTVKGFTADSIRRYYHEHLLNKSAMFLVVAGKITKEELEKKITASFAGLPARPFVPPVYEQRPLTAEHLLLEPRDLATNYISCIMNAPTMNSPDYYPFMLGINVLSGSLNYELRTKQGLSYAPGATIKMQQMPYMSMYVSTTQPKKAYEAMVMVYKNIRSGHYNLEYLNGLKKDHRSKYYRHQESSSAIVNDLGEAEVLGGYQFVENKIAAINKVTLTDMNQALNKYLKGAVWVYLGNESLGNATFK